MELEQEQEQEQASGDQACRLRQPDQEGALDIKIRVQPEDPTGRYLISAPHRPPGTKLQKKCPKRP
jgi:hypothetical protein